jgi:hypothetical protein
VLIEDFGLVEKSISDLSFTKVFLSVLDLKVCVLDKVFEGFFDLHGWDFKLFLNLIFGLRFTLFLNYKPTANKFLLIK